MRRAVISAAGLFFFLMCSPLYAKGDQEAETASIHVFVSIAPQEFLISRIGGERITTTVLVQEGQDPHTFDPKPSTLVRLSEADLYFRMGMEFENALLIRIGDTIPDLTIIDCRNNVDLRQMSEEESRYSGEHGADPHIWMSVRNAITIARTMSDALTAIDPAGESVYRNNLDGLIKDLRALDAELARILTPLKGKKLFVFHPAFGYFADDYGLVQTAVETGGNEPSARQLAAIIEEAKKNNVRVLFVQPQFSQKSARAVAEEIGGAVVPIDSLARNYTGNMIAIARAVEEGVK